jgi:hypothetical protein
MPYLPNGNPAPGPKFDYKLHLFERLTGYFQSLLDSGPPAPISRGNRKFESISLQQTVRLSPAATFERQKPGLSQATGSVPALAGIVGVSAPGSETTAVVKKERRNMGDSVGGTLTRIYAPRSEGLCAKASQPWTRSVAEFSRQMMAGEVISGHAAMRPHQAGRAVAADHVKGNSERLNQLFLRNGFRSGSRSVAFPAA